MMKKLLLWGLLFQSWLLGKGSERAKRQTLKVKRKYTFSLLFILGLFLVATSAVEARFVDYHQQALTQGSSPTPTAVIDTPSGKPSRVERLKTPQKQEPPLIKAQATDESSQLQPFDTVVKGAEQLAGLFTLYRNNQTGKIYLELKPEQLNKNYLATITMESGIGERGIYSGIPLQDILFYFRRVNNNVHFAVRNVNFRTRAGNPEQRATNRSFSDSVLYSLNIQSIHPERQTLLIDLGDLLLSDLPGLGSMLRSSLQQSYQLDANKSYFDGAKAFPLNIEIESVYGFSLPDGEEVTENLLTLPDARALTLRVRYSLSQLTQNSSYVPRLADDRVGYFTTVYQNFSNDNRKDPFVRYIQRWHLEKQDPKATLSPPKKPIVFWIENAMPLEYREGIREGVLMWNKAFEKVGFKDALEVQQMPDNATWDPADVRYNTIRWSNSVDMYAAFGPSRVNPLTGEILDADIVVDANYLRAVKQEYQTLIAPNPSPKTSLSSLINQGRLCTPAWATHAPTQAAGSGVKPNQLRQSSLSRMARNSDLCYSKQSAAQLGMGSLSLKLSQNVLPSSVQMKEFVHQAVRETIAHEVGHTLGLAHNFHGSTMLKLEDLNNTDLTQAKGLVSSVMDYNPPNIAPKEVQQGDYFTRVVGPYDQWAIEYGYKPSDAVIPQAESRFLETIAQKQATQPELAFATDEDISDVDPRVNPFDLSDDVLSYSQTQLDQARELWKLLEKRYPTRGESYSDLNKLFDMVFGHYFNNVYFMTKYVGGVSFNRDHPVGPNGRLPFEPVPVAKQRQALAMLQKYVFAEDAFNFSPQLLNKLAPSRWYDWGNTVAVGRLDYPIHDILFSWQSSVLRDLLSGERLDRMRDLEVKTQLGDALTLPELFNTLQMGIWTEVLQADSTVKISSFRRALQLDHLNVLIGMVLRTEYVPEDARTLAASKLRQLQKQLNTTLRKQGDQLDDYTKAHLEETRVRVTKALDAQMLSS